MNKIVNEKVRFNYLLPKNSNKYKKELIVRIKRLTKK